jgi:hypothetical protein
VHLRLALILSVLVASAVLFPVAFFGVLVGYDGLRSAAANPQGAVFLLPDLAFLVLGLGAAIGPLGILGVLLVPKTYFSAHPIARASVTAALIWGILSAFVAGCALTLGTLLAGATHTNHEWFIGPLALALFVVGVMVLRAHRR